MKQKHCKDCVAYPPSQNCGECPRYLADEEEYPEPLVEFENGIKDIVNQNGFTEEHAACYICNFEDQYICREYNGGCNSYKKCKAVKRI